MEHKRVVIIGGGMMGVGLLYHLAEMVLIFTQN